MSSVSARVRVELAQAQAENQRLVQEKRKLVHECRIAYLEGLDQGRAEAEAEAEMA